MFDGHKDQQSRVFLSPALAVRCVVWFHWEPSGRNEEQNFSARAPRDPSGAVRACQPYPVELAGPLAVTGRGSSVSVSCSAWDSLQFLPCRFWGAEEQLWLQWKLVVLCLSDFTLPCPRLFATFSENNLNYSEVHVNWLISLPVLYFVKTWACSIWICVY